MASKKNKKEIVKSENDKHLDNVTIQQDIQIINSLEKDSFIFLSSNFLKNIYRKSLEDIIAEIKSKQFSDDISNVITRFLSNTTRIAVRVPIEDFMPVLEKLGLQKDKLDLLGNLFRDERERIISEIVKRRVEVVPWLSNFDWRVDLRYGSSSYQAGPEPIILIRIETTDGTKSERFSFESGLDGFKRFALNIQSALNEAVDLTEKVKGLLIKGIKYENLYQQMSKEDQK